MGDMKENDERRYEFVSSLCVGVSKLNENVESYRQEAQDGGQKSQKVYRGLYRGWRELGDGWIWFGKGWKSRIGRTNRTVRDTSRIVTEAQAGHVGAEDVSVLICLVL